MTEVSRDYGSMFVYIYYQEKVANHAMYRGHINLHPEHTLVGV